MVAVRMSPPYRLVIVGSPAYLTRRGRPDCPDDLRQHACLRLRRSDGGFAPWPLNDSDRTIEIAVAGPLIANDFPTLLAAAIKGVGLAQVPEPLAMDSIRTGELQSLLDPFAPTTPGIFLYYPNRRQMLPKLRAFVDHVKGRAGSG
jgi:DNA-binding transcriptional LysR family regulator